jgi:hypothetical protein
MWFFVVLAVGSTDKCSPAVYAVCQSPGSYTNVGVDYETYSARKGSSPCTLCASNNCTSGVGVSCYQGTSACSWCGTLDRTDLISTNAVLTVQRSCTSNLVCPDLPDVTLTRGSVFYNSNGLKIHGKDPAQKMIAHCPAIVFSNTISVEISRLVIECKSPADTAILFTPTKKMALNMLSVWATGSVHTVVTVVGRDLLIPTTDITGSSLSDIAVTNSTYRMFYDAILTSVAGSVDVGGLTPGTTLVINPSGQFTLLNKPPLRILDVTEYVGIQGDVSDLEVMRNRAKAYTDIRRTTIAGFLIVAIVFLLVMIAIFHQDVFFRLTHRKKFD